MTYVDRSLARVRRAVRRVGKKPLATRAQVAPGVLRLIDEKDFSPTARSLRALEQAAIDVEAERRAAKGVGQGVLS